MFSVDELIGCLTIEKTCKRKYRCDIICKKTGIRKSNNVTIQVKTYFNKSTVKNTYLNNVEILCIRSWSNYLLS